jgi:DNA-directed RNA polymerase subunit RPC12/RpoP
MILVCSQCGAKIKIDVFKRFLNCPYCKSSLVVDEDRTFNCYILKHSRNEAWVRGLVQSLLNRTGLKKKAENIRIDFKLFPVWHVTFEDGETVTQPAAKTPHTEISSIKIPAGKLEFFDPNTHPTEVITPTVRHRAATVWTTDIQDRERKINRLWLVYLPIYFIDYRIYEKHHRASVVGDSTRIYSDTEITHYARRIPVKNLIFYPLTLATFLFLGFYFFEDNFEKIVSIVIAAVLFVVAANFFMRK